MQYKITKLGSGYAIFRAVESADIKKYNRSEYWNGEHFVLGCRGAKIYYTEDDALSALVLARTKSKPLDNKD